MRNVTLEKCKPEHLGEYGQYLSKDFDLNNYFFYTTE